MEQREQKRKLLTSTFAVSVPTVLSRILGYFRDMIQAKHLGTGRGADAFTIAYIIPNLLRRLTGEGTMTAAFVPVFTQVKKERTKERKKERRRERKKERKKEKEEEKHLVRTSSEFPDIRGKKDQPFDEDLWPKILFHW